MENGEKRREEKIMEKKRLEAKKVLKRGERKEVKNEKSGVAK